MIVYDYDVRATRRSYASGSALLCKTPVLGGWGRGASNHAVSTLKQLDREVYVSRSREDEGWSVYCPACFFF